MGLPFESRMQRHAMPVTVQSDEPHGWEQMIRSCSLPRGYYPIIWSLFRRTSLPVFTFSAKNRLKSAPIVRSRNFIDRTCHQQVVRCEDIA